MFPKGCVNRLTNFGTSSGRVHAFPHLSSRISSSDGTLPQRRPFSAAGTLHALRVLAAQRRHKHERVAAVSQLAEGHDTDRTPEGGRARRPAVLLLVLGWYRVLRCVGAPQPRARACVVAGLPERAGRAACRRPKTAGAAAESHLSSRFAKTNEEMRAHALTKYQNL